MGEGVCAKDVVDAYRMRYQCPAKAIATLNRSVPLYRPAVSDALTIGIAFLTWLCGKISF
jgi:hypothetical protein